MTQDQKRHPSKFKGTKYEQKMALHKQEICSLYRLAYQKDFNKYFAGKKKVKNPTEQNIYGYKQDSSSHS